ncbi:hypothetical protein OAD62_01965, partial [Oceanihabitans sp.]|nr:hypothetical protein [Oceanihabitans sp.]
MYIDIIKKRPDIFRMPQISMWLFLIFAFIFSNTFSQTVIVDPNLDGGFENGNTFLENSWRVTNSPTLTNNQWVCNTGATPGFSGSNSAYVSNNAGFPVPPHKYTASPARASHITRTIFVPAGETEITVDFIWIGQGENEQDMMRIWIVPISDMPIYGTAITAAPNRVLIGDNYSRSSTWTASPTLFIPPAYAGTAFRFVVEWVNNTSLEFDPPAGIDDISIVSNTPPPPPNDEPCTAINIPSNATCNYATYTNYGATNSTSVNVPPCANYISGDVWFTTTYPASGGLIFDTISGEMIDGGMAIYTGSCGALSLIECDDNDSTNGLMPYILNTNLTPGQTIYIRVWESGYDNNGTFGICITPTPDSPVNDECGDAIGLTVNPNLNCNVDTAGTTAYGTASPFPDDVIGFPENDVWFYFVATSTSHRISLLDRVPVIGTSGDLAAGVYNSPSGTCSALTLVLTSNLNVFSVTGLDIGDTYYVRIYGRGFGAASAQTDFTICIATPPPPPPNNFCTSAIGLTLSPICDYDIFTNAGASGSSGVPEPGCAFYSGGDVWFYTIVDDAGEITVDTQAFDVLDAGMALYLGDCNSLTLLDCDNNSSANGAMPSITATGLTPGEVVYIRFWDRGNNNFGNFGICATSPSPLGVIEVALKCPGEPSDSLFANFSCLGTTSLGDVINGTILGSDPVALQPVIFIASNDPCEFDPVTTSNYSSINFTVTTTGTYLFSMNTPSPYFDAMGYIVVNDGNFVPGSCATGTYIAGDDDDGASLNPQITANLIEGVPYTLITTKFSFTSTSHVGSYTWNVSGPPTDVNWYVSETGGSPISSGSYFNPVGFPGAGLPDTNAVGVYPFWINCPYSASPRTKVEFTIGKIWSGILSSDWNDFNNWIPSGRPTNSDCVYINNVTNQPILNYPGIPSPPNPAYAKSLTIGDNATLELEIGTSMTVTDEIDVANSATFIVRNNANLIQETDVVSNNNTGFINMQRAVTGVTPSDYIYWSSPVDGFDVTSISPGSNTNYIYKWIPTVSGNGTGNYGEWQFTNETMQIGKGYIIRGLSGTAPLPPTSLATTEFTGTPNNGIISIPIQRGTYAGANYPGAGTTMATALDDNWNLIGNPYPSSISARDFITVNASEIIDDVNASISGTVYLWRHLSAPSDAIGDPFYGDFGYNYNPNDYIKFNHTGSSPAGFNGYIGAGQSFFVLMDHNTPSPNASVIFNNTMRSDAYRNDQFYRTEEEPERHRIWLDLINSNNFATSILIGYVQGATNGIDRLFDGHELNEVSTRFYSLIDDDKMTIQGKALPFDTNDTVPLGIELQQSASYTIAINTIDGLFEATNQDIYLEDTYNNSIHDLKGTPYTFTSDSGVFNDRFILRYTNNSLSIEEETW